MVPTAYSPSAPCLGTPPVSQATSALQSGEQHPIPLSAQPAVNSYYHRYADDTYVPWRDRSPSSCGWYWRIILPTEASQPLALQKIKTVASSFAPAYSLLGMRCLLFWRLAVMLYFTVIGILWSWSIYWTDGPIYPPVYLTNWGAVVTALYWGLALANSVHSKYSLSVAQWQYDPHAPEGPNTWWWLCVLQIFLFELSLVLETLITVLYWAFESSDSCTLDCITVHGLGLAFLLIELFVSRTPFRPRHVILTVIYPILWVASQAVWVHTDHVAAYKSLSMRDGMSALKVIGGLVAFVIVHFLYVPVVRVRDHFCCGRFYI